MNKITKLLAKISDEIKELIKKFPITMAIIIAVTLLATIMIDQDISRSTKDLLGKIYLFGAIWAVGTVFTECYFVKKTAKGISYGLTGGISFIFTMLLTDWVMVDIEISSRFLSAYVLVLILASMHQSMKNAQLKFQEYLIKMFRDLFHISVIYAILNIGILLVTAIFVLLILDGRYSSILVRILTLLFGLFYVPSLVYTLSSISKKEVNPFIKGLILYVLLPLVTIAMAIIYLYMAKILLWQEIPKNTIFRILAGIFVVAFPVWNMASNYREEKKWVNKLVTILPYLFAPFLLLEIYSIGVRIHGFGLTSMRYMSCVFIVFQAICLGLTFYKKQEKLNYIFLCAGVMIFITFVTPLNYQKVPNLSQKHVIETILPPNHHFDDLSEAEKKRVSGAYEYLVDSAEMPTYLSEEEKNKIKEYRFSNQDRADIPLYISLHQKLDCDVEKYARIKQVSGELEEVTKEVFFEKVELRVDLKEFVDEIIHQNETNQSGLDDYFKANHIITIDNQYDLYLSDLYFRYNQLEKTIEYSTVEGYLLQK